MSKGKQLRLTKRVVDAAEPGASRYIVWDNELIGFGIRIEVSGTKAFLIRYRAAGGGRTAPQRLLTIGKFGNLTVDEARKHAKVLLGGVALGEDPGDERRAKRMEMTICGLIDLYEAEGCYIQRGKRQGEPMKERTKTYTIARLRHHVVPLLGHKRVSEVGIPEVERFFRDVAAGKSRSDTKIGPRRRIVVRGGDGAARKVFRDLSAVFSFACRYGILATNPCGKAVVKKTDHQRTRFLTLDEVKLLGAACDTLEGEGVNIKALTIARLWALTGCRRQEIIELKWDEIDFERGLLILDDSKTGKSVRPLAAAAIALLRDTSRVEGSSFVFPADRGDGPFQGTKTIWPKIIKRADLPGVTPHTLRHTLGATATSSGEALALTGAILGHASLRSTTIYAHVQHDPARKAADRVGRQIAAALAGKPLRSERSRRMA